MNVALLTLLMLPAQLPVVDVLLPRHSEWKYLDDGSNQGSAWRDTGFDDSSWSQGFAELGYGDSDEATVISFGPNSNDKHITTYFRRVFSVANPGQYSHLGLRLLRDDGAVVYLNGTEVQRSNLPGSGLGFNTVANSTIAAAGEHNFSWAWVDPQLLVPGDNLLAVEVHQRSATSSDLSFDLELVASDANLVTRGPYLQLATPTSIRIRWRTDQDTDSAVRYGLSPTQLNQTVTSAAVDNHHSLQLTGLTPETRYYYSVGTTTKTLAGEDATYSFRTPPEIGASRRTRIWVVGDSGTADQRPQSVRDAYQTKFGYEDTDLWLMLGDNAYDDGLRPEFQAAVFDTYPELLRRSVVWPTRGNHETQAAVYYDLFTLPTAGEAGGLASGTEAYYSFDHGNIHFICLDSHSTDRSPSGAMALWLENDLAATDQEWIIAFWHHPPYTKGSHDSDTETKLVEMRSNFLPILEAGGVDLVLCGHSHSYERSYLIDGHYGTSGTFQPSMKLDSGDGREDGDGAYKKTPEAHQGAVYCVAGSSGKLSNGPLDHPAMVHSVIALGSVVLTIEGRRLDLAFLDSAGQVEDRMTLVHQGWLQNDRFATARAPGPVLLGSGETTPGADWELELTGAPPRANAFLVVGFETLDAAFHGGTFVPVPQWILSDRTDTHGSLHRQGRWPEHLPPAATAHFQYWVKDPLARGGLRGSNAVTALHP